MMLERDLHRWRPNLRTLQHHPSKHHRFHPSYSRNLPRLTHSSLVPIRHSSASTLIICWLNRSISRRVDFHFLQCFLNYRHYPRNHLNSTKAPTVQATSTKKAETSLTSFTRRRRLCKKSDWSQQACGESIRLQRIFAVVPVQHHHQTQLPPAQQKAFSIILVRCQWWRKNHPQHLTRCLQTHLFRPIKIHRNPREWKSYWTFQTMLRKGLLHLAVPLQRPIQDPRRRYQTPSCLLSVSSVQNSFPINTT